MPLPQQQRKASLQATILRWCASASHAGFVSSMILQLHVAADAWAKPWQCSLNDLKLAALAIAAVNVVLSRRCWLLYVPPPGGGTNLQQKCILATSAVKSMSWRSRAVSAMAGAWVTFEGTSHDVMSHLHNSFCLQKHEPCSSCKQPSCLFWMLQVWGYMPCSRPTTDDQLQVCFPYSAWMIPLWAVEWFSRSCLLTDSVSGMAHQIPARTAQV